MDYKILGKRIYKLRTEKGFSQAEMAMAATMSRTDLSKIEHGLRKMSVDTLIKLSTVLEISVDELIGSKFPESKPAIREKISVSKENEERISKPSLKAGKLKQVLLYVLERCSGKPNVGETVLNKLMYFIEFNYYERYENHFIGMTFKKLQFGPVPDKMGQVLAGMQVDGVIKMIKTEYHGLTQKRYIPLSKPDLTQLTAAEIDVVNRVIDQLSDFSAKAISDYSHEDIPWKATREGNVIDYELAFYRETPFSARTYDNNEVE